MKQSPLKKLLVRQIGSNKFLRATGRWTKRTEKAFNFPTIVDAVHTCLANGIKNVEFILRFEGDSRDQCIPMEVA
jgi:hypothetical protein